MSFASSAAEAGNRITRSAGHSAHRVRKPAFYALTVAFLAFLLVALGESMTMVASGWFGSYEFPIHRVHHVMIGGMLTVFAATIAVQLYRPTRRIGALQAAIVFATAALVVTLVASGPGAATEILAFVVPVALIAALHPARDQLVPTLERLDTRLLALAAVGALGFTAMAVGEFVNQTTLGDEHVLMGHYEFMAFALLSVGLFALLASFRPAGWRALVYAAAAVVVVFAAASLAFPGLEQGSSLGTVPSLAAIGWAVAFVGFAEYVDRVDPPDSERVVDTEG